MKTVRLPVGFEDLAEEYGIDPKHLAKLVLAKFQEVQPSGNCKITLSEASSISGYAIWTLQKFARQGEFGASKPRGNRGGWEIDEASFRSFLRRRKIKGANQFLNEKIKRGEI